MNKFNKGDLVLVNTSNIITDYPARITDFYFIPKGYKLDDFVPGFYYHIVYDKSCEFYYDDIEVIHECYLSLDIQAKRDKLLKGLIDE